MGLDTIGIGRPSLFEKHAGRKAVREAFGLDKPTQGDKPEPRRIRDLSTKNMDVWTGAFQGIRDYLEPSDTQHFHLFLMGCGVGKKKKASRCRVRRRRH